MCVCVTDCVCPFTCAPHYDDVQAILGQCTRADRQTSLFSATLPAWVREVAPTSRAGRGVRGWWSRRRLRGRAEKALRAEGVVERYLRE